MSIKTQKHFHIFPKPRSSRFIRYHTQNTLPALEPPLSLFATQTSRWSLSHRWRLRTQCVALSRGFPHILWRLSRQAGWSEKKPCHLWKGSLWKGFLNSPSLQNAFIFLLSSPGGAASTLNWKSRMITGLGLKEENFEYMTSINMFTPHRIIQYDLSPSCTTSCLPTITRSEPVTRDLLHLP